MQELVKSVRLAASGIGIGSFAYLRRIFEFLIFEAFNEGKKVHQEWNESEFRSLHIEGKIKFASSYLPELLVKNSLMYGILSSGVHTLSEGDCITHFPVVRGGIELMLDQKLAKKKQQETEQKFIRDIQNIGKQLNS